jgi:Cu/Ag efflux pump CusA
MIEAVIRFSLRFRLLVAAGVAGLVGVGIWSFPPSRWRPSRT